MYKYIEPEVAGGLGEDTIIDSNSHPPIVDKLHYELQGWLGDDLIESFPCFVVTEHLHDEILKQKLSGIIFDNVTITGSEKQEFFSPNLKLPVFYWMKITGKIEVNDFAIAKDLRLIVSERAYKILSSFKLNNALIADYSET